MGRAVVDRIGSVEVDLSCWRWIDSESQVQHSLVRSSRMFYI